MNCLLRWISICLSCLSLKFMNLCGTSAGTIMICPACASRVVESRVKVPIYTFLDDKNLFIGMLMQPYFPSCRHVNPNKRDLGILMLGSHKFIGVFISRQFTSVKNGVVHSLISCQAGRKA